MMKISLLRTKCKYLCLFMSVWLPLFFMMQGCSGYKTITKWEKTNEKKIETVSQIPKFHRYRIEKVKDPNSKNPVVEYQLKQIPMLPAQEILLEREMIVKEKKDLFLSKLFGLFGLLVIVGAATEKKDETDEEPSEIGNKYPYLGVGLLALSAIFYLLSPYKEISTKSGNKKRYSLLREDITIDGREENFYKGITYKIGTNYLSREKNKLAKSGKIEIDCLKDLNLTGKEFTSLSPIKFNINVPELKIDTSLLVNPKDFLVPYLKITKEEDNIRKEPQVSNNIFGQCKRGEKYKILSFRDPWYQINYRGDKAWTHKTNGTRIWAPLNTIPAYPAVLAADISFSEPSGDSLLNADETAKIILNLKNSGKGEAYNMNIRVNGEGEPLSDLIFQKSQTLNYLGPGQSKTIEIPIKANRNVKSGQVRFKINVDEVNGFNLNPPLNIKFPTQEFLEPELVIADIGIDDQSKNRKIEPLEIVSITCRIQNAGQGRARSVSANIKIGENVFIAGESPKEFEIGTLEPSEYKDISFEIYTNTEAKGIPLELILNEDYGFGKSFLLEKDLPFNIPLKTSKEIVIRGKPQTSTTITNVASLTIDVDVNIPKTDNENPDAVAVVIGNKNYENTHNVDFAIHDAAIVKEYLINIFGYKDGRIIYLTNAKQSDFNSIFGIAGNHKGTLYYAAKEGKSDIFIYYSGHGAPNIESKDGYFVPVDCDPRTVAFNGYSLNLFYENLEKIIKEKNLPSANIVIDACFSGSSHKGNIMGDISPVGIRIINPLSNMDNVSIFTSSSGNEVSSWYRDKQHGMFTYFFLKGLQGNADFNKNREIICGELFQFLSDKSEGVPYYAGYLNKTQQTPTFAGEKNKILVKFK